MLPKCVLRHIRRSPCRELTPCRVRRRDQGVSPWRRRLAGEVRTRRGRRTSAQDGNAGQSRTVDLDGPVHYVDFGGDRDRPGRRAGARARRVAPELGPARAAAHRRTPASGPSTCPASGAASPGHRLATVPDNVAVLEAFPREVVGRARGAGGQLDGRDDLDPADGGARRRRSPAWCCSTPRSPARGGRSTRWSPLMFAVYAVPLRGGALPAAAAHAGRRRWPACGETLALCGVDPDAVPRR